MRTRVVAAADHLRGDAHTAVFRQTVGSEVMLVEIRVCCLFKFAVVTMTDAPTVTFVEDVCVAVTQRSRFPPDIFRANGTRASKLHDL